MASRELRELFSSVARRDWITANAASEKIAALEESRGRHASARSLRDTLRANAQQATPITGESSLLLSTDDVSLADVSLPKAVRLQIELILREQQFRTRLADRGLKPRSKILFSGPPGCGKTLTSKAIASALRLPHYIVRFDGVIASLLGQTAINIRRLFQIAEETECVLLFDEIDALGKTRGSATDVGELDRIVIALMQELELSQPRGLIIAASNLPRALDQALLRRFDSHVVFPRPTTAQLRAFASDRSRRLAERLPASFLKDITRQPSYSSAERMIQDYVRTRIMSEISETDGAHKA